jgi:hypothetical protein
LKPEGLNPGNVPLFQKDMDRFKGSVRTVFTKDGWCLNATKVGASWITVNHHHGDPLFFDQEMKMPLGPIKRNRGPLEFYLPKTEPQGSRSFPGKVAPDGVIGAWLVGYQKNDANAPEWAASQTSLSKFGVGNASSTEGSCGCPYLEPAKLSVCFIHTAGGIGQTKGEPLTAEDLSFCQGSSLSPKN